MVLPFNFDWSFGGIVLFLSNQFPTTVSEKHIIIISVYISTLAALVRVSQNYMQSLQRDSPKYHGIDSSIGKIINYSR